MKRAKIKRCYQNSASLREGSSRLLWAPLLIKQPHRELPLRGEYRHWHMRQYIIHHTNAVQNSFNPKTFEQYLPKGWYLIKKRGKLRNNPENFKWSDLTLVLERNICVTLFWHVVRGTSFRLLVAEALRRLVVPQYCWSYRFLSTAVGTTKPGAERWNGISTTPLHIPYTLLSLSPATHLHLKYTLLRASGGGPGIRLTSA